MNKRLVHEYRRALLRDRPWWTRFERGEITTWQADQNFIASLTATIVAEVLSLIPSATGVLAKPSQALVTASGAPLTPNGSNGPDLIITIADSVAWTLVNQVNFTPPIGNTSHWWIRFINTTGGAGGAITLGSNYRTDATFAPNGPAAGMTRICPVLTSDAGISYIGPCSGDMPT